MSCSTPRCRKTPLKGGKVCGRCMKARWRAKYPIKAAYQNLKDNAKSRGKSFSLTLEQFKEFAIETDYMLGRGRKSESFHIDRIIEEYGYHWWNIQKKRNFENSAKYRAWLKYSKDENGKPENFHMEHAIPADSFEDVPF